MRLFRPHEEAEALAFAARGGQALHFIGLTPARLYDRNVGRLVTTVRAFGQNGVAVARTGGERQHVVLRGMPLVLAALQASRVENVVMADIVSSFKPPARFPATEFAHWRATH